MSQLNRVFYHELGHFVAHELNRIYYTGLGTKSISIFPFPANPELYLGEAKMNLSPDEREKKAPSLVQLPVYLASSSYGCIFQSYYMKTELKKCFDLNGEDDMQKWIGALFANCLDWLNSDIAACEREYFDLLSNNRELDVFMQLNTSDYLIESADKNYSIDIANLRSDTAAFVEKHYSHYNSLIEKISQIIDGNVV
jgi:hypothetical protein